MEDRLREILEDRNPWWRDPDTKVGRVPAVRRSAFERIHRLAMGFGDPRLRAILVVGLRQVGKTTLARQVLDEALRAALEGSQVAYVPVEECPGLTLDDALEAWRPYLDPTRPALLVLDEVQSLHESRKGSELDWARQMKSVIERNERGELQVRVLATGSAAGKVLQGAAHLVGRTETVHVPPLSFGEFLALRSRSHDEHRRELESYLEVGGLPISALEPSSKRSLELLREYAQAALEKDLDVRRKPEIRHLFAILMDQSGEELNESSMATAIRVGQDSIRSWIAQMEDVHLIRRVPRWTTSELREIRGQAKMYGPAPGIVAAFGRTSDPLGDPRLRARLVEAAVLCHLAPWADEQHARIRCAQRAKTKGQRQGEIDFVVDSAHTLLLLEVTSGTSNLREKVAFVSGESERLRDAGTWERVLGAVVHGGSERIEGPVPGIPLADFLLQLPSTRDMEELSDWISGKGGGAW